MYILHNQYVHADRQRRYNVTEAMLRTMNECYHQDAIDMEDLTEDDIKTAIMVRNRELEEDTMRMVTGYEGDTCRLSDWIVEWIIDYWASDNDAPWIYWNADICDEDLGWREEK